MNIDIKYQVDPDKLTQACELVGKSLGSVLQEINKASQEMGSELFRKIIRTTKLTNNDILFENYLHSDGLLYFPIQVNGYPVERVVGGIKEERRDKEAMRLVTSYYLLCSTYGSFLMFRIQDDKAIWSGGLNGTVQQRFQQADFGGLFRYYSTIYTKLRPSQVLNLYDPDKTYKYLVEAGK